MTAFPLSKTEWYAQRDDRTKRIDGAFGFDNFRLGVIIEHNVESPSTQIMAIVVLNILGRWCRRITIEIPPQTISCLPFRNGHNLVDTLKQIITGADSYGEFGFGKVEESECDEILVIGQTDKIFHKPHAWIGGGGWMAGVGFGKSGLAFLPDDGNVVGPAFASCLGSAEVFKYAIGLSRPDRFAQYFSLYDFTHADNFKDLELHEYSPQRGFGKIHQIGCGAVGASLDFLLSLTEWKADIDLIDYDPVSFTNCNRSLAFSAYDAVNAKKKVEACRDLLNSRGISSKPFLGSYDDFLKEHKFLDNPPDLILCLANEQNIWSCIQNNYPPLVLHATTTANWGLNFGRHIPQKEWCIVCRFAKEMTNSFTPICGEGIIGNEAETAAPIQGVLPFLSPAAAVLILAEMAKMNLACYPINKNFIQFSMKTPVAGFQKQQRKTDPNCITCKEQSIEFYPDEIRSTKFWNLTLE